MAVNVIMTSCGIPRKAALNLTHANESHEAQHMIGALRKVQKTQGVIARSDQRHLGGNSLKELGRPETQQATNVQKILLN